RCGERAHAPGWPGCRRCARAPSVSSDQRVKGTTFYRGERRVRGEFSGFSPQRSLRSLRLRISSQAFGLLALVERLVAGHVRGASCFGEREPHGPDRRFLVQDLDLA